MQIFLFLLPQLVLFLSVVLVFGLDLVGTKEKKWLPYLALTGAVISLGISIYLYGWMDLNEGTVLGGMIAIDSFSLFFQIFASLVAVFITLLSMAYMKVKTPYQGEYYSFILLASFVFRLGFLSSLATLSSSSFTALIRMNIKEL